jgi:hypothetical protein
LIHVVLGDPERLEFIREKQVVKLSGEVIVVICFRRLFVTNLFNSVAGIVAAT